jgi:hypothetical protein
MTERRTIQHEFVEFIPEELEEGVLYISIPYATTQHSCLCGCGNRVVLPLHPTHWQLLYDGETVSLKPSVGNWSFPCRSHYWIARNRVRWAGTWTREQIERGRQRDRTRRERRAGDRNDAPITSEATPRRSLPRRMIDGILRRELD